MYSEDFIKKRLSSLQPSVDVINHIVDGDERYSLYSYEEKNDAVSRNYRHLEIVLNDSEVISNVEDVSAYTEAIVKAKSYLGITEEVL